MNERLEDLISVLKRKLTIICRGKYNDHPDLRTYLTIRANFKSKVNLHNTQFTAEENEMPSSPLTGEPMFAIDFFEVFKVNFHPTANRRGYS